MLPPGARFEDLQPYADCFLVMRTALGHYFLRWPTDYPEIPAFYLDERDRAVPFYPSTDIDTSVDFVGSSRTTPTRCSCSSAFRTSAPTTAITSATTTCTTTNRRSTSRWADEQPVMGTADRIHELFVILEASTWSCRSKGTVPALPKALGEVPPPQASACFGYGSWRSRALRRDDHGVQRAEDCPADDAVRISRRWCVGSEGRRSRRGRCGCGPGPAVNRSPSRAQMNGSRARSTTCDRALHEYQSETDLGLRRSRELKRELERTACDAQDLESIFVRRRPWEGAKAEADIIDGTCGEGHPGELRPADPIDLDVDLHRSGQVSREGTAEQGREHGPREDPGRAAHRGPASYTSRYRAKSPFENMNPCLSPIASVRRSWSRERQCEIAREDTGGPHTEATSDGVVGPAGEDRDLGERGSTPVANQSEITWWTVPSPPLIAMTSTSSSSRAAMADGWRRWSSASGDAPRSRGDVRCAR